MAGFPLWPDNQGLLRVGAPRVVKGRCHQGVWQSCLEAVGIAGPLKAGKAMLGHVFQEGQASGELQEDKC